MLTIVRLENTPKVTRGILLVRRSLVALTLELPWRDNEPFESCIPPGSYVVRRHKSSLDWMEKHGTWTYQIVHVRGREGIEVHPGNTVEHTDGCILPGFTLGVLDNKPAVLSSGPAFRAFMLVMAAATRNADHGIPLHIIKMEM